VSRRLGATQIYDHQSNVTQAGVPLLVADAWEHAYYLQYKTRKTDYFAALSNLWDWEDVERRLLRAQELDLELEEVASWKSRQILPRRRRRQDPRVLSQKFACIRRDGGFLTQDTSGSVELLVNGLRSSPMEPGSEDDRSGPS
jgi:hypothetical protein